MFQELSSGVWFCASSRQQHSKTATSSRQQNNNIFFEVSTVLVESKKKLLNLFLCCEINSKFLFFPPKHLNHTYYSFTISLPLSAQIFYIFSRKWDQSDYSDLGSEQSLLNFVNQFFNFKGMESEKIDWNSVESIFVEDDLRTHWWSLCSRRTHWRSSTILQSRLDPLTPCSFPKKAKWETKIMNLKWVVGRRDEWDKERNQRLRERCE